MQLLIAQPVFRQRTDLEVLHQDVAIGDQPQRDLLPFRLADIQRDRHLVAVHANEIRALLGPRHERRSEAAGIVTGARPLDLDHLGAQIAQHLRAGGTREHTGQVEHAQPLERAGWVGHAVSPACRAISVTLTLHPTGDWKIRIPVHFVSGGDITTEKQRHGRRHRL